MATSWENEKKPGAGWLYNQTSVTYNGPNDSEQNLNIYYDSLGFVTVWTADLRP